LSGPFKSKGNLAAAVTAALLQRLLQKDYSITNNIMQQKGSFSMPGKRK